MMHIDTAINEISQQIKQTAATAGEKIEDVRIQAQRDCQDVAKDMSLRFERQGVDSREQITLVRSDMDKGINSLQTSLTSVREELQKKTEHEAGKARQALLAHDAKRTHETSLMREAFENGLAAEARRCANMGIQ